MGKKKQAEGRRDPSGQEAGAKLPPGVKLVRVLTGHTDVLRSVAFAPQGGTLASGSDDKTVKLWEAASGQLLRTLEGHQNTVYSVAFAPQGGTLASGSSDKTVKLWEAASGRLLRTLEGHQNFVGSVAFAPQRGTLASGSDDQTVKVWDAASGRLRRTLEGHQSFVLSVAFAPQGGTLANGSGDKTVKLWDAASGRLLRTLEGHTERVDAIAFSPDGQILASKSADQTIRLWSCATWETVAVIPVPTNTGNLIPALAFDPTATSSRPLLATASSPPDTPEDERCREIHLYELDCDLLLGRGTGFQPVDADAGEERQAGSLSHRTVHSATAKIVLVGDSGVGKTGLGWRLAHGEYREHDSTHGQQFWVLNQLATTRQDGTQCEAVLWDLAGQPDYRLIHALSIQDADLALVLFDPTNNRDPLGSAEYWLRQLPAACPKILVAARVDRGHPVLTDQELNDFCRRQVIAGGWIATSARENVGLNELLQRIKQAIPWDLKEAVSTDAVFKRIKDFVLALKESRTRRQVVFTAKELGQAIRKKKSGRARLPPSRAEQGIAARQEPRPPIEDFTDPQLLTAIRHLSSQGFVRMLVLSSGEERILLVPELLNNLAASIVLEARRNERGLGAVEEGRLFDGNYGFRELTGLSESDRELLLDGTIEAFLTNRLSYRCFREHAGAIKLLVFPDLMNLKKPQREDLITENGASYILSGSTENTFAGLVVLLGYTNLFARTDQAHDVAWFQSARQEICGVRQIRDDNERTIVLLFSRDASANVRQVFEGLVEQMLSSRDTHVRRVRPVKCGKCGTPVDRAVMARRLKSGKSKVFCEDCGAELVLPPDEPLSVKPAQQKQIAHEGAVAERRTKFEEILFELTRVAAKEKRTAPTCFVSYAWGNTDHERWVEHRLATDLDKAGFTVILDRWENRPGADLQRFIDRIGKADRVLIVGTPDYWRKYENKDPSTGSVVALEMKVVWSRLTGPADGHAAVIPLLLAGDPKESLPPVLQAQVASDFRNDDRYFDIALELMLGLYGIEPRHAAAIHWTKQLKSDGFERWAPAQGEDDEELPTDEEMHRALKRVGSRALHSAFDANQPVVVEQNGTLVWLYSDGKTKKYVATEVRDTGAAP